MASEQIRSKLKLIMEGYIDEDSQRQYLNESIVIAGLLMTGMVVFMVKAIAADNKQAMEKYKQMHGTNSNGNKPKANSAEQKQKREEYLKHHSIDQLENDVKKDIKKIVSDTKKNQTLMDEMKKRLKDDQDADAEDRNWKLTYNDEGDYIQIIQGTQYTNSSLDYVIENIKKAIDIKYAEPISLGIMSIGTGDGDEGCIYVNMN